jgi:protoheme IX farnesyltransferase
VSTSHPSPIAEPKIAASRFADYSALTKPRITTLVLLTTLVGHMLGAEGRLALGRLIHLLLATGLVAGGASALNQFLEREADARMYRTRRRPLPSGRLTPDAALIFAVDLAAVGLVWLAVAVSPGASLVAALTLGSYVLAYTPLKRATPWCTAMGAIPGALPPVIGWVAARGELGAGAVALFALLYAWQLPHFFAIAWLYREDYARGRFPMWPVVDPSGTWTFRQITATSILLLAVSVLPTAIGLTGYAYLAGAIALGAVFVLLALGLARRRDDRAARRVFFYSILYLPAIVALMLLDRASP